MKHKLPYILFFLGFLLFTNFGFAQNIWINELHYDNDGGDVNEGFEIAGPEGTDLKGYSVIFYNGSGGGAYGSTALDGVIPNKQGGFGMLAFTKVGIQNGPDALALVDPSGTVIQFISYEAEVTATDGPAINLTSIDIMVSEGSSTPTNFSLQLEGEGQEYGAFTWASAAESTFGEINNNQDFGGEVVYPEPSNSIVFINEFHYDNDGGDSGEGFEIAGTAGTDLAAYSIVLYNGADQKADETYNLSGSIPNQQNGYGTLEFPTGAIQNGAPDGFALIKGDEVIQFLSYEGTFVAADGPAQGLLSTDVGVDEPASTSIGFSLQLKGTGLVYEDFTWDLPKQNTFGEVNTDQVFGEDQGPEPETCPDARLVINELDADTPGSDTMEFVELYDGGCGNYSLDGYVLVFYNGSNDKIVASFDLSGYLSKENGYFVAGNPAVNNVDLVFGGNTIQNGADAVALYKGNIADFQPNTNLIIDETLVDAVVYGTNDDEDEELMALLLSGDQLDEDALDNKDIQSLQRFPDHSGERRSTLSFINAFPTPGAPNWDFTEPIRLVINEFDSNTPGTDEAEFIEIFDGGTGNFSLDNFVLVLFNGSDDLSYETFDLNGFATDENGYFVLGNENVENVDLTFRNGLLQNGSDAIAIYYASEESFPNDTPLTTIGLIDAVVYGEDDGLMPLLNPGQIALEKDDADNSQQRILNGRGGQRNTDSFLSLSPSPGEKNITVAQELTIAEARDAALDTRIIIEGVLTSTSELGNTAYIQDETAGIALFGNLVTGEGLFEIGDKVRITGYRAEFNGLVQLSDIENVELLESGVKVDPIEITLSQLENYRGQLVTIKDAQFPDPGQLLFGNNSFLLTDASGTANLYLDPDVDSLIGKIQPESCTITGVVGYYYGVQILPRTQADLPCAEDYDPSNGLEVSYDQTLDVATWNLEFFGFYPEDASKAPAPPEIQKEAVKNDLLSLNADVIAVQEVVNVELFAEMVSEMEGYDFILSDAISYPNSTDQSFGSQRVGFIFKTDVVQLNDSKVLLESIHPFYNGGDESYITNYPTGSADSFWASGRLPFLIETTITLNGESQPYSFVVIHAKSGDNKQDYLRREYDNAVLKDSLDAYYGDRNLMLLGDYNDDVDQTIAEDAFTESSYYEFINDEDYWTVTSTLSEGGYRSTVGFTDMIDHITITDELFEDYIENSVAVHYEFYDAEYSSTTTDHFAVSARFIVLNSSENGKNNPNMVQVCFNGHSQFVAENAVDAMLKKGAILGKCDETQDFYASPNPVKSSTTLMLSGFKNGKATLSVYSLSGNLLESAKIQVRNNEAQYNLNMSGYMPGLYIIKVQNSFGQLENIKVIKK